jgi:hypothetical protein
MAIGFLGPIYLHVIETMTCITPEKLLSTNPNHTCVIRNTGQSMKEETTMATSNQSGTAKNPDIGKTKTILSIQNGKKPEETREPVIAMETEMETEMAGIKGLLNNLLH